MFSNDNILLVVSHHFTQIIMQQKQAESLLTGLSNGVFGIFVTYIVYEILGEKSEPLQEFSLVVHSR